MTPLASALLSILSAIVVAGLAHVLAAKRKQRDELAEMRLRAYTDFISAASRVIAARRIGRTVDALDDLAALNDAKARICICAEPSVVSALAKFWDQGGTLEQEQEILAFSNFCNAVRTSLGNADGEIRGYDLADTLFKLQPSKFSFVRQNDSDKSPL